MGENWPGPDNTIGYTGYDYDAVSNLYYAQARYYMPEIGRFISEDPWPGSMAEPATMNPYPYVKNNPLRYIDPTGMASQNDPGDGVIPGWDDDDDDDGGNDDSGSNPGTNPGSGSGNGSGSGGTEDPGTGSGNDDVVEEVAPRIENSGIGGAIEGICGGIKNTASILYEEVDSIAVYMSNENRILGKTIYNIDSRIKLSSKVNKYGPRIGNKVNDLIKLGGKVIGKDKGKLGNSYRKIISHTLKTEKIVSKSITKGAVPIYGHVQNSITIASGRSSTLAALALVDMSLDITPASIVSSPVNVVGSIVYEFLPESKQEYLDRKLDPIYKEMLKTYNKPSTLDYGPPYEY